MTTSTADETKPKKTTAEKPVEIVNLTPAPFYYDDSAASVDLADKGILTSKVRKPLTPAQWARRTPDQWGVLVANEQVQVHNVPASDLDAFDAAVARETKRLQNARSAISPSERALFSRPQ